MAFTTWDLRYSRVEGRDHQPDFAFTTTVIRKFHAFLNDSTPPRHPTSSPGVFNIKEEASGVDTPRHTRCNWQSISSPGSGYQVKSVHPVLARGYQVRAEFH